MEEKFEVLFKRKNLPDKPGIYIYKNSEGRIIYIGKAKSLYKRVSQYFSNKFTGSAQDILYGEKIKKMVEEIADIDFIITDNEKEALLLENDMIKKYQPKYNIQLKDDKSFPYIVIKYSEEFPRVLVIRQHNKYSDESKLYKVSNQNEEINTKDMYFGPYIDVKQMRDMLAFLRKYFPYCTCKRPCSKKSKPCLYYQLKLCTAPCTGNISREKYLETINQIKEILKGNIEEIINILNSKMKSAAKELNFELAAEYRDKINALERMIESQAVVQINSTEKNIKNFDVVGIYRTFKKIGILILHIRNGRIFGKTPIIADTNEKIGIDEDLIFSLLEQFYINTNNLNIDEIILPNSFFNNNSNSNKIISSEELQNNSRKYRKSKKSEFEFENETPLNVDYIKERIDLLKSAIGNKFNKNIEISNKDNDPYIKKLKNIVEKNVALLIRLEDEYLKLLSDADILIGEGFNAESITSMDKKDRDILIGLKEIKDILSLKNLPRVIEGIDISDWQQMEAVGSVVVFIDGKPHKSEYRNYIIKNIQNKGDTQMMTEVAERRYSKFIVPSNSNQNETKNDTESNKGGSSIVNKQLLPDLIIVDGGKGQVGAISSVLEKLGLKIPVIGLAKKKSHNYIDRIVFLDENENYKEIKLKEFTAGYNLLQSISQEYHRRAIQHHRKRVAKDIFKSPLDQVPNIGIKTKNKLIEYFGNIEKIIIASEEDFVALFGLTRGKKLYKIIMENLKNKI